MELTRHIDGYCERLDPGFWAEPVNALTNIAFLVAAIVAWRRGPDVPLKAALCLTLAAIGVGSFLFHSYAQVWAALSDVIPIGVFILLYVYVVNRFIWGLPVWGALAMVVAFVPYAALLGGLFQRVPFFGISAGYWPVPVLIAVHAALLWRRHRATAAGLAIGAAILTLSLTLRSLDMPICPSFPLGTHFLWHLLNAVMLGWMIEVYRRHMVATGQA